MTSTIGGTLRPLNHWRRMRLLTIRELAEKADVAPKTITDAEHGRTRPTFRTIRKLSEALDVEPMDVREFAEVIEPEGKALAA